MKHVVIYYAEYKKDDQIALLGPFDSYEDAGKRGLEYNHGPGYVYCGVTEHSDEFDDEDFANTVRKELLECGSSRHIVFGSKQYQSFFIEIAKNIGCELWPDSCHFDDYLVFSLPGQFKPIRNQTFKDKMV